MAENDLDKEKPEAPESAKEATKEAESTDLKAQLEKAKNDYLYLAADFDNYRKNSIKERSELMKFGAERLVRELLGVVDNFERALENDSNQEKFNEGVKMIYQDLKGFLQKIGVTEIPTQGLMFDPTAHEAVTSEPTDAVPVGHVARVFKKAYKLHDRMIRPAQVVVATAPAENKNG